MSAIHQRSKEEMQAIKKRVVELRRKDDELTQTQIATRLGVRIETVRLFCLEAGVPFAVRASERRSHKKAS